MVTYITRAQIGLRAPNGSHSLVPSQVKNTAFHYPGTPKPIDAVGAAGLARVCSALRGWQAYHMDTRGWSDIAYQIAIDQVGRAYTLRGINIRSAANGDAQVNLEYGAILLVLGNNEAPSAAMEATARAVMQDYRVRFAKIPVRPTWHGAVRPGGTAADPSTTCPGKLTIAEIKAGKFDAGSTPVVPPTPPGDDMPLNDADKAWISNEIQRYAAFGAKHTDQVEATTAGDVDVVLKDDFASIGTKLDTLIASVDKLTAALTPKA